MSVKSSLDILTAKKDGKVGIIFGTQNASPIENDLDRLALFHALGMRVIQLTYHERNLLGNGCFERTDDGLSNFGVEAIREMNRLGILIDLSHVGDQTTVEAIACSEQPVAITHANARSFFDHRRSKTDDALKLLADKGGVVGAVGLVTFLRRGADSTLEDYVDAIDDLVERVGIDHVGIGVDFTQNQPESFWRYIGSQQGTKFPSTFVDPAVRFSECKLYPQGFESPDKFPNMARALLERGCQPEEATKILGGNWLRLFREVWRE